MAASHTCSSVLVKEAHASFFSISIPFPPGFTAGQSTEGRHHLAAKACCSRMDASNVSIGTLQAAQRACRCYINNSECTACQPSDQSCMCCQHVAAGPHVRHQTGEAQPDPDHFWKRLLVCLPSTKRLMVSKLTLEISGPRAISRTKPYSTPSTTWTKQRK